ncbi:MAG: N-acetyltransferase [Cyclobacteriaceae bacterium]|nr:N-acetyltransferase [Cyclobacteriaceae bacterium HetDA_MAG_MS6]
MSIEIKPVESKRDFQTFIKYPSKLYKGNPYFIPPLLPFERDTLNKSKNPAFDHCQAQYWLAKKDGHVVGRIAGIIHETELEEKKLVRFGWVDFIDDEEVSNKLIDTVIQWGKASGATGIHGPLGFTDLDFEGTLIEGFDQLATQATIYNHSYYQSHFEGIGFQKAVDWVEIEFDLPDEAPERLDRIARAIESRLKLDVKKFKKVKQAVKYGPKIFDLLNRTYAHLYGYHPLSQRQIDYYIDAYLSFVRLDFLSVITDENDDVIAFAICIPSFSRALQKSNGRLFPFGFIRILLALKAKNELLDLFLICVEPKYQKLGVSGLIFHPLLLNAIKSGVKTVVTGPMLEDNLKVQNLFKDFEARERIRRRCFIKEI